MRRRRFFTATASWTATLSSASASKPAAAAFSESPPSPADSRRRVLFFGVDALDPAMVARYLGDLPNISRMMREGYSGRVLPYVSCWSNIDFMSMMTGAPPGVQYRPALPDGSRPRHQNCISETIWQVLSSERRRSLLLSFPGSRPDRFTATLPVPGASFTLARAAIYQTLDVQIEGLYTKGLETTGWPPGGGPKPGRRPTLIEPPHPATGWRKLPASNRPPLEFELGGQPALLTASGPAYDTLTVYARKASPPLARTVLGQWSSWGELSSSGRNGKVRYRLLEATRNGRSIQVLRSPVCRTEGFSSPPELAGHLVEKLGPLWTGSAIPPAPYDPFWEAGEAEALEGALRVADAAFASLEDWDWDFFLHKNGLVDTALHQCLTLADPSYYNYDPEIAARADRVYRRAFIDLDHVIGRLLSGVEARADTILIVASDHGGGVNNVVCDINQRLRDTGLLAGTDREIAWSRTRAYTKRSRQGTEIFVNLAGREPHGTVKPADYEAVQEAVIDALLDWRGPLHDKRVITYALKLRDAALIGYWGPEAGDVQFCYNPGFVWGVNPDGSAIAPSRSPVSNHGPQIVTGATGYSSMMGQLLAWGPGIARGVRRDESAAGPIPIASVAPTLSRLLGCRTPRDCELGLIQEMLA